MNKNIKNLVDSIGTDVSGKWVRVDQLEKLINLTVNDCIDVIQKSINYYETKYTEEYKSEHSTGLITGHEIAVDLVKNHFDLE